MKFHPKILGPAQARGLRGLGKALRKTDFYLADGTALAIQLGHQLHAVHAAHACSAGSLPGDALPARRRAGPRGHEGGGRRGARVQRDFVDIYALGQSELRLSQMLAWYQEKYQVGDTFQAVNSLNYFEDAAKQPMPLMLWKLDWRTVKKTIHQWVKELAP